MNKKILFLYHHVNHKEITHIEKEFIEKKSYKTYFLYYGKRNKENIIITFIRIIKDALKIKKE